MQVLEKVEKIEEESVTPFDLNRAIFGLLNFNIVQFKDIDNQHYTFFVIISKERKINKIEWNDYSYLYFVKVYKDNKFLENWTFSRNRFTDSFLFLTDKIIARKILGYTFIRPSKELNQQIPSDFAFENSLFSLHLLLKLDFSSFDFDSSRMKLDRTIRNYNKQLI